LVDEEDRATPSGEVGELIVASPYVSLGRWVEGRLRTRALKPVARADGEFFAPATSCARGPTGCWSESAARTGKSRYAGLALISTAFEAMLRGHAFVRDVAAWHGE
jgi:hypothetical protein